MTTTDFIINLIRSFPCLRRRFDPDCKTLRGCMGDPRRFDPRKLARALRAGSTGEVAAGQFILTVWFARDKTSLGRFSLVNALGTWDAAHREAFLAWAEHPYWP